MNRDPLQATVGDMVNRKLPFPSKLYRLLEDSAQQGNSGIVSWLPDGKSFKVHKPSAFTSEVMPSYFSQTKYNSFRRQCYIYGFRLRRDGAFCHPQFTRGSLETSTKLQRMVQDNRRRKRVKKDRRSSKTTAPAVVSQPPSVSSSSSSHHHTDTQSVESVPNQIAFEKPFFPSHVHSLSNIDKLVKPLMDLEAPKTLNSQSDLWDALYDPLLMLTGADPFNPSDHHLLDDIFSQELEAL